MAMRQTTNATTIPTIAPIGIPDDELSDDASEVDVEVGDDDVLVEDTSAMPMAARSEFASDRGCSDVSFWCQIMYMGAAMTVTGPADVSCVVWEFS